MCVCISTHLAPIKAQPRLLSVAEHLPQSDPKHPGIRRVRESTRLQRLWSTPGEGHGYSEKDRGKKSEGKNNCGEQHQNCFQNNTSFSATRMLFSPRERDFVALLHDVLVGVCWQCSHQAKVSDLHRFVGGQQDVAGRQVPVEETSLLQVGHAARHLHTHRVRKRQCYFNVAVIFIQKHHI